MELGNWLCFSYENQDWRNFCTGYRDLRCRQDTGSLPFLLRESGIKEKLQRELGF